MLNKIILGTVQLGLNYGINNLSGKPTLKKALGILETAYLAGINQLDTSDLYGDSQEVIAKFVHKKEMRIFTKFSLEKNPSIRFHLESTLTRLGVDAIEGYSFHRLDDYLSFTNWKEVEVLKKEGKVKSFGVSLYTNDQLKMAISNPNIDIIQLPLNLLDHEKMKQGLIQRARDQKKKVHARSVYLQGLFFKDLDTLTGNIVELKKDLEFLQQIARANHLSLEELAMGYVMNLQNIDGVLIGVENEAQLNENISLIKYSKMNKSLLSQIESNHVTNPSLLNPSLWRVL
jgi:aryl-alcohol dehydrogenase-like predicted oxidoreductase